MLNTGRTSDYVDENHGDNGLKLIQKKGLRIKNISMSKKAYRIANLLIANHCREDDIGIAAIKAEPTFSVQDKRRARKNVRLPILNCGTQLTAHCFLSCRLQLITGTTC